MQKPTPLSSLPFHLAFAVAASVVLLGADYIFSALEPTYRLTLDAKKCAAFFLFNFLASYIPGPKTKLAFYCFVTLCSFVQMVHIKYFGSLITPYELYAALHEAGEIYSTLSSELKVAALPVVIFCLSLSSLIVCLTVFAKRLQKNLPAFILIILLLIFLPARAFFTKNEFGKRPNPNASTFYNAYGSFSYFLGKILPRKMASADSVVRVAPAMKAPRKNSGVNIVLIMGESVNLSHLSLYGYKRKTTPFLDRLAGRKNFVYKKAISGGVSTDVSLPLFFNSASGVNAVPQIISMNGCLFKMAAENNFKTYYFSAHPGDSMKGIYNYLCPKYIDQYHDAYTFKGNRDYFKALYDKELLNMLKSVDLSRDNFIVLQIRASHSPYSEVYPREFQFFETSDHSDGRTKIIDDYDNSLRYVDSFISDVAAYFERNSPKPVYLLFTGDHGEALGEGGRYGHLRLYEEQFTVPFFIYGVNADPKILEAVEKEKRYFSHLEISRLTGYLLGYYQTPLKTEKIIAVAGHDIDGTAGHLTIKVAGESIVEIKRH